MTKKKGIIFLTVLAMLIIFGTVFAFVSLDKGQLGNVDYVAYPKAIKLGLDLKGGVYAVYNVKREKDVTPEEFKRKIDGTIDNFEELLFSKGYPEAKVVKSNVTNDSGEIRVEVPNVKDPEAIFNLIGRPAVVLFKKTDDKNLDPNSSDVVVNGRNVKRANVGIDENGKYQISLEFDAEGAKAFAKATAELVAGNKPIHIFVNGKKLISPRVQAAITNGKASITGQYTYEEAESLAVRIQSGSLPLKLELAQSDTISPTLGEGALRVGIISGGVGLILIFILLIALYGLSGVAASIALIYYTLTYLFFLAVFPWVQLTLPGIAGILLSLGMAVDANIIIFERIKEEYRSSGGLKSMKTCISYGFRRSTSAIIDGNVTTIIGAIILMIFGVAAIKGFAITLLIGIVFSLLSSLVITRLILSSFVSIFNFKEKAYGLTLKQHKYLVSNMDGSNVEGADSDIAIKADNNKTVVDEGKEVIEDDFSKKEEKPVDNTQRQSFKGKYKKMERKNKPAEHVHESKFGSIRKHVEDKKDEETSLVVENTKEDETNE